MEIWVNPACSKCQAATSYLDEAGIAYTVRRYLDDPPTAEELTAVLDRLGLEPWDVARTKEPAAARAGLRDLPRDAGHRAAWVAALVADPILIQRPILTADDGTTVVGRDEDALQRVTGAER
jgi:arsenate reductase